MTMDPKQERALRDGTASVADQPRDTDIESVREQAENPSVSERPRPRRRTAAAADVRVNQEAGTPVDQMARELGAEPVPEVGRAPGAFQPTTDPQMAAPVAPREARRTLKARRDHSKGDGNFPAPEPSPQLIDERPEDRGPRDVPKSRDDRSAPKGNITAGQDDRNPNLETADDQRPGPPSRAFSLDAARDAAAMPNAAPRVRPIAEAKRVGSPKAERTPSTPKPKSRPVAKRTGPRPRAQERTRAGSALRATNRAKPKRAMAKRATPKRSAVKRTAPRKRTAAKRTAAKRTAAKRPATRAKRRR